MHTPSPVKVVSAFPGIGKSFLTENGLGGLISPNQISDSDFSLFSWIIENDKKIRNPNFKEDYLAHIKEQALTKELVLVSSHEKTIEGLLENFNSFIIVYPSLELKDDFLERYVQRGSPKEFVEMMEQNWEKFITSLMEVHSTETCKVYKKVICNSNVFLSDIADLRMPFNSNYYNKVPSTK